LGCFNRKLIGITCARLTDKLARQPRPERRGKQQDREEGGCDKATHARLLGVSAPPLGEASNLFECQSVLLRCRVCKWHFCDVARPPIDFHFSWKSGRAADITATTDFDPKRKARGRFCCESQPEFWLMCWVASSQLSNAQHRSSQSKKRLTNFLR
jgi:hypothetical protein